MELKYNVAETICRIAKRFENSKLTNRALKAGEFELARIAEYLKTDSNEEAALFCIFFKQMYDDEAAQSMSDLSRYLGVSTAEALKFYSSLIKLTERGILIKTEYARRRRSLKGIDENFSVNPYLSEKILENQPFEVDEFVRTESKSINKFLSAVASKFFDMDDDERMDVFEPSRNRDARSLEEEYRNISGVKKCKEVITDFDDRFIFYDFCKDCIVAGSKSDLISTLGDWYSSNNESLIYDEVKKIKEGKHSLVQKGLIELIKDEQIKRPVVKVTEKGIRLIMQENAEFYIGQVSEKDLIKPEKITAKELFYSNDIQSQMDLLSKSLEKKNFRDMQKRMKKSGLSQGLCVLFYGEPGTGKTESANQIAKKTKRAIYHVDISQTKSCWFGESEKIIKEVFQNYNNFCKSYKDKGLNIPILLFNEADAVFSKRKDVGSSNVAQTENAIQNIILEQMETFEGILIATTNLADNLDAAFERRFLFKVKFERPTLESRSKIWLSKLPGLSETAALALAEKYNFSGGEIDNVVRKNLMNQIINGDQDTEKELFTLCSEERLNGNDNRQIGFGK